MRLKILILLLIISTNTLFRQSNDRLGLNYNPKLTPKETAYFNKVFIAQLNHYYLQFLGTFHSLLSSKYIFLC